MNIYFFYLIDNKDNSFDFKYLNYKRLFDFLYLNNVIEINNQT